MTKEPIRLKTTDPALPPIIKAFGKLERAQLDDDSDDNRMYFIIELSKTNKRALDTVQAELEAWEGKDVYIEVRQMLKR